MDLLASHRIFETKDLGEGSWFASQMWERNKSDLMEGTYGLRWNNVKLQKSMLSYIEQDGAVDLVVRGPLSDHFRIFVHKGGAIEHTLNGQQLVSDSHNTIVHAPGVDLKFNLQPFELLLVTLPGEFVRKDLTRRFTNPPPMEAWVGALPSSPCVDSLKSMLTWLCNELDRPGSPLAKPGKPRRHAERMLLATFVECLMQMSAQENEPVPDIGEQQVRLAEEWIDAHVADAIGVEEIADAVGIGVRSLQRTFHRVRGYSPLDAILKRRLERVRQALLTAAPGTTVTSVATEFGFFELGRFAKRYSAQFGENPSQTLARRFGSPLHS